jgi:hypothetical protein
VKVSGQGTERIESNGGPITEFFRSGELVIVEKYSVVVMSGKQV